MLYVVVMLDRAPSYGTMNLPWVKLCMTIAFLLPISCTALVFTASADTIQCLGEASCYSSPDNDVITGTPFLGDEIVALAGDDVIYSFEGEDLISGNEGDDLIYAGPGSDVANGGSGDDSIIGDEGDDFFDGNLGNDRIVGGAGNDVISGSGGDDDLVGDDGNDHLYGGPGADQFWCNSGMDRYMILIQMKGTKSSLKMIARPSIHLIDSKGLLEDMLICHFTFFLFVFLCNKNGSDG